jgi:hypothetical protein
MGVRRETERGESEVLTRTIKFVPSDPRAQFSIRA